MPAPSNRAVWLSAVKAPFQVREAPYTSPKGNELVIKSRAVAINPIDWIIQKQGGLVAPWLKFPFVLGTDVAGEVVEIGSGLEGRYKVGDRVLGHAVGFEKAFNTPSQGAFQDYVVLQANLTSTIPSSMTFEEACVIPLGLSTAACALYQEENLGLEKPSPTPTSAKKGTVIIWGGSTSVGCNAIQLAKASGYEVITTSSPKNFPLMKRLGASLTFDYNDPSAIESIIKAVSGKLVAGAVSIGYGAAPACLQILSRSKGNKRLAMISFPGPPSPPKRLATLQTAYYYVSGKASIAIKAAMGGIHASYVWGGSLSTTNLGAEIYNTFLPKALENGSFTPAPEPQIVGRGLDQITAATKLQEKGVSAKKLVVTL